MAVTAISALINSPETVKALAKLYDQTARRIIQELVAGVSKAQAFRAETLLARLKVLLKELDPKAASRVRAWIQTQMPKAFVVGDQEATAQLRSQLAKAVAPPSVNAQFTVINSTAMRGVMAAMEATLGKARDEMERALGTVIRQTKTSLDAASRIRSATAQGFIRGAATQQVADDIAGVLLGKAIPAEVRARLQATGFDASMFNSFEKVARTQLIRVGKRTYTVRSYSDLVARTQMREIARVGSHTRYAQNGVRHVQILRHEQDHIDVCTAFMGRVFYTGEGQDPQGFPSLRSTPNGGWPWHPYCECNDKAYIIPLKSALQVENDRGTTNLLPAEFFGTTSSQVTEMVQGMSAKQLRQIGLPVAAAARGTKEAG